MQEIEESPPIIDQYFHSCLKRLAEEVNNDLCCYHVRWLIAAFVLLLHCYASPPENQEIKDAFTFFLQLLVAQNVLQVLRLAHFRNRKLKNRNILIKVANDCHHCLYLEDIRQIQKDIENQELFFFEMDRQWGLRVSSGCYDFQNMERRNEVSQQNRQIRQKLGKNIIKNQLQSQICCYRIFGCLFQCFALGILVYSIVLAFQLQLPGFQSTFLQLFILFQFMLKPKLFLILIMICLVPLILIFAGIYWCFCYKQIQVKLPQTCSATLDHMTKCTDCAICFQSFALQQKIIPLSCSDKHIFHQTCIKGWVKIKATCPICRSAV